MYALDFSFKRCGELDIPLLYRWFQKPHVRKWWPVPAEKEHFFDHFLKRIRSTEIVPYIVYLDNEPIGYLQTYPIDPSRDSWLPQLPVNTIGIDQFIGEKKFLGKGIGTCFIKKFITFIRRQNPDVSIILDPDPKNLIAIRCYEKVGFDPLGTFIRNNEEALVMIFPSNKQVQ